MGKYLSCFAPNLRLVFPTLAKNDSPLTMMPQFLQVLGKKIEFATTAQDSP